MRLFLALNLPEAVQREAEAFARELSPTLPKARWVRKENLHITLVFLGDTDDAKLSVLVPALKAVATSSRPVTLRVVGGGTFPSRRPARVAWLGVEAEEADLTTLRELVANFSTAAAATAGFAPEPRVYTPHLTLARAVVPWSPAVAERFTLAARRGFGEPFSATSAELMESQLAPGGSRYRVVESIALGVGA